MAAKTTLISVDKLAVGMYVDIRLGWSQHPFLFRKLTIKSHHEIKIIKDLGLKEVLLFPEKSDPESLKAAKESESISEFEQESDKTSSDEFWQQKQEALKKADSFRINRRKIAQQYREKQKRVKNLTSDLKHSPANAIRDAGEVIDDMLEGFTDDTDVLINLVSLSSDDHSNHCHSLNVTVLSLTIGHALKLPPDQLKLLGLSAILHDIGKAALPASIFIKKGKKTPSEIKVLQTHTTLGARIAEALPDVDSGVVHVIRHHHEFLDGTGYPNQLKGDAISTICRIVTIANIYDNLCNNPDPTEAVIPKVAMATLFKKYQGKLDIDLVQHFIKTFGVYPPGTVVQLNDDSIALVISVDPSTILNPKVLLYNPDIPPNQALLINLADHDNLEVVKVLKPGECPPRVYEYLGIQENMGFYLEAIKKHPEK
ncbi:HD-GYP domain-containing protein [Litoribrevibacter albus]|uniref:HD family phosphohydrolase n=1 Tax=Litoribrevibacter albus TaxID=1473156 RepID=A0AA37SDT7_9GAMM|nr:HD domain-containing phosphohydrolase [Litoribrevibacter albus]GLQ33451.1 HD family phosphohydrolase [Litoribrevibacter albus]